MAKNNQVKDFAQELRMAKKAQIFLQLNNV